MWMCVCGGGASVPRGDRSGADHLVSHNRPARRERAHLAERPRSARRHAPPAAVPHTPAAARRRLPGRRGRLALTLRFPLVRCLFFPPMVAVPAELSARSPS